MGGLSWRNSGCGVLGARVVIGRMTDFPTTREAALARLALFVPQAGRYGWERNHAGPSRATTSGLGPALARRLVTEREVIRAVLAAHPFGRVEKFVQEVLWRRYWKEWMETRPETWVRWRDARDQVPEDQRARISEIEEGRSGVAVMDAFARQLLETGWLHNHVRMWFAAWWIHTEGLPWQAGADFFLRHLLDGDAASNTLSWRWVAGLQTPGKTYLARRANLEKHLDADWLVARREGWDRIEAEDGACSIVPEEMGVGATKLRDSGCADGVGVGMRKDQCGEDRPPLEGRWLLWIHDEDLSVERHAGGLIRPCGVVVAGCRGIGESFRYAPGKVEWIKAAMDDAAARAAVFGCAVSRADHNTPSDLGQALVSMAREFSCDGVMAMRPMVGPLADAIPEVAAELAKEGVALWLPAEPEDARWAGLARGGFFRFWKDAREGVEAWARESP